MFITSQVVTAFMHSKHSVHLSVVLQEKDGVY